MPLKLKLAAHERLIVNGAVMVNGGCRTTLIIRNFAHIMREKDVLQEEDANTPTRRLYFILQAMLMQPPPPEPLKASYRLAHTQLTVAYERPENLLILAEVDRMVELGDFYKAMMKLHPLIAYEAELLNVPQQEWRRASQRDPQATRTPGGPQPGSMPARYPTSARAPNTGGSAGLAAAAQ
jgi:flagellar biosynthesis repressor protein FlbT